jgi:hypothetical protein
MIKKIFYTLAIAIFLVSPFIGLGRVSAISNYNDLIDDAMFNNVNSMSAPEIDAFLNNFPNSCISENNGFNAPLPTGYSPTTKFTYGNNVSAGLVIATIAQAYHLNPKVLITTLEKEQGLVTGTGTNIVRNGTDCGALAISAAVSYNCPDSLLLTNYGGFELYAHNGVDITSVNQTCVRNAAYVGFSQQLTISAWQLTFDQHRSEGQNNWYDSAGGWDNSDDLRFCYSGYMISGGPFKNCPDSINKATAVNYSGLYSIDGATVQIFNGASAALYNYTPHLHGQALFVNTFNSWFGSTYLGCGTSETVLPNVLSYYNPKTYDHFYTVYQCEANILTANLGYVQDGSEFNTTDPTIPGSVPVHRLYNPRTQQHLWTTTQQEIDTATHYAGYQYEGVAFYAAPYAALGTRMVWRLYNPYTYQHVWTTSQNSIILLTQKLGFNIEGVPFFTQ